MINTLFINNNVYQQSITYNSATPAQLAAGPVYPNFLPSTSFTPPAGTVDIVFADKNLRNPYTHQANVGIERELTSTLSLNVSYVWSRGVRLYGVRDLNVGPLGAPVTYTILNPAGTVEGTYTTPTYRTPRPDPRYRRVTLIDNPGMSYYNGLVVQLNKRLSRDFQGGLAYTWAHAIDLNQSNADNNIFFGSTPTSYANGDFAGGEGIGCERCPPSHGHQLCLGSDVHQEHQLVRQVPDQQLATQPGHDPAIFQPINSPVTVSGNAFTGALVAGSLNGLGGGFSRVPFQPIEQSGSRPDLQSGRPPLEEASRLRARIGVPAV